MNTESENKKISPDQLRFLPEAEEDAQTTESASKEDITICF